MTSAITYQSTKVHTNTHSIGKIGSNTSVSYVKPKTTDILYVKQEIQSWLLCCWLWGWRKADQVFHFKGTFPRSCSFHAVIFFCPLSQYMVFLVCGSILSKWFIPKSQSLWMLKGLVDIHMYGPVDQSSIFSHCGHGHLLSTSISL